jgi:hypothetical protein
MTAAAAPPASAATRAVTSASECERLNPSIP